MANTPRIPPPPIEPHRCDGYTECPRWSYTEYSHEGTDQTRWLCDECKRLAGLDGWSAKVIKPRCSHTWRATQVQCCLELGHADVHHYRCADPKCEGRSYPASVAPHMGCGR